MNAQYSSDSLETFRLGGVEQWVLMRGRDRANPVLLLIQQGPGLPIINEAAQSERLWHLEDEFTVVYWDQRGCGKSFSGAIPPHSLTTDQLVADTHELIAALCQRLDVPDLYVAGFSFGGMIAARTAARYPEHIRALVTVGMDVHFAEAERVAYAYALERATRAGHRRSLRQLRRIGPPPHLDGKSFGTRVRWLANVGGVNRQETYNSLALKTLRQLVSAPQYTPLALAPAI